MSSSLRIKEITTTHAGILRSNMTIAENTLWQTVRNNQINGYRFRRQHPIGNYIADFTCVEKKLVIELDGGQHLDQINYDENRTQFLQQQGWSVLRFWNNEVLNNPEGVLLKITEMLSISPYPSLPLRGEGIQKFYVAIAIHTKNRSSTEDFQCISN